MAHALTLPAPKKPAPYVNRRMRRTLSWAGVWWGLYSVYSLFFSPFLAPRIDPTVDGKGAGPSSTVAGNLPEERRQAEQFLSNHPWAAEEKGYHFRTESGFFYFKKWDNQVDDGRKVRFKPFAMIWRPKGHKPENPPYTIVSESAVVEFTSPFEIANTNPGRVVGGALEGDVQIRGSGGLEIDGQQFYFGEQVLRVWSDHAIRFQHGLNRGQATGVELDLIAAPNPEAAETLAITGVRTVRLRKAVKMELRPAPKEGEKPGPPVFVDCEGAFEYEVNEHIAKFERNVRARRPTGRDQLDALTCETLTLVFEPDEAEKPAAAPATPAGSDALNVSLKFRRLLATGPEVFVRSDAADMQGWMRSLNYDEQSRIIALSDDRNVRLLQRNNEVLCPEITAVLDESKQEIDRVDCRGSGQLYRYAPGTDPNLPSTKKKQEASAKWQRKLSKAPDPETGLDLIELEGRAELTRAGGHSLEADVIGIWVTRSGARIDRNKSGSLAGPGDDAIQPKKLLAIRDVRFASPQIQGRTENLSVWFEEGPLPAPPVTQARKVSVRAQRPAPTVDVRDSDPERTTAVVTLPREQIIARGQTPARGKEPPAQPEVSRNPAAPARSSGIATIDDSPAGARSAKQPSNRPPTKTPVAAGQAGSLPPRSNPPRGAATKLAERPRDVPAASPERRSPATPPVKPRDKPMSMTAELIQVRAMRDGDETQIAEVVTEGRVHVQQEHASGELPLDVTGDKLLLWNYGETNQILEVFGKPAQVQDRKMQLEGPEIRFDRVANRALVNGAGVLRVPVPNGMDGKRLAQPQILDVFWNEKMDFDGKIAKFFGAVRSRLDVSELRCEEMHVTFNRRVDFADEERTQQTEIHSVLCRDGVDLKSYEYEDTRLVSVRMARGFEFKLNQLTGQVTAQGPGTLELWRRGARSEGPRGGAAVAGNKARKIDSPEWQYTWVKFLETMDGNTRKKETTFRDVERVIYGPVASSTDTIDLLENDAIAGDGGWMSCQELTISQIPGSEKNKEHLTMRARGNAILEGRSFHAQAHIATYDESLDQYILQGDGKRDAFIWRETKPGSARSAQSAQRMRFIPSRNVLDLDRVSGGEYQR